MPTSRSTRSRGGFTVVEVLVALVVVTVGLLGMAGMSTSALRGANAALRGRAASTRARTRLALLTAAGCAGASGGEVREGGAIVERWTVGPRVNGVRMVEARSEWDDTRDQHAVRLSWALLC